jgi:hypothetical protein
MLLDRERDHRLAAAAAPLFGQASETRRRSGVLAENLLLKHQLLVLQRSRRRARSVRKLAFRLKAATLATKNMLQCPITKQDQPR